MNFLSWIYDDPLNLLIAVIIPFGLYILVRICSHAWYAGKRDFINNLTKEEENDNG